MHGFQSLGCSSPLGGPWARRWINHIKHMASASPDLRSPSQPQSVTALWQVPSYTAWWQRHTGVSSLPKATAQWYLSQTQTPNLCMASPMPYELATCVNNAHLNNSIIVAPCRMTSSGKVKKVNSTIGPTPLSEHSSLLPLTSLAGYIIKYLWHMATVSPDLRSPSQPRSVTGSS